MTNKTEEKITGRLEVEENGKPICLNSVCPHCVDLPGFSNNVCDETAGPAFDCLYKMGSVPPNSLDYNEYMPTHKEALDRLEVFGLLSGNRAEYEKQNVSYNKPKSSIERGNTEISGINFNQAHDAIQTAIDRFIKDINEGRWSLTPDSSKITATAACIEIEKAMGIYPNISI